MCVFVFECLSVCACVLVCVCLSLYLSRSRSLPASLPFLPMSLLLTSSLVVHRLPARLAPIPSTRPRRTHPRMLYHRLPSRRQRRHSLRHSLRRGLPARAGLQQAGSSLCSHRRTDCLAGCPRQQQPLPPDPTHRPLAGPGSGRQPERTVQPAGLLHQPGHLQPAHRGGGRSDKMKKKKPPTKRWPV